MHKFIIFENFREFLDLNIANTINDDCVVMLVATTDAVLIDLFGVFYSGTVKIVLNEMKHTSYSDLNWM